MGRLISEKYAAWQVECEERFQQLKKNEEELQELDKKREGIIQRYNEEIEILRSAITSETKIDPNFNNSTTGNAVPNQNLAFCPECGAANPEGSIFCSKCGTKLEK